MEYSTYSVECTEDGRRNVAVHELRLPYAKLTWECASGEVVHIGVNASHQRQGIARTLWEAAQAYGPIRHSAWRTEAGDAFARAVGGELPRRIPV